MAAATAESGARDRGEVILEEVNCHICGSNSFIKVVEGPDRMFPAEETFCFVRCTECGLIYLQPRPTPDEMSRYYPSTYAPHQQGRSSLSSVRKWLYEYGLRQRCRVITSRKVGGRLLDVGCANGTFLAAMDRLAGWEVEGVELSEGAVAHARERGLQVFAGKLLDVKLPARAFDVVTLWDTLEHLYQPLDTLVEIHRILKPQGLLVLRLPHLESINRRLFGRYWGGWDAPRHLHLFPHSLLKRKLRDIGFMQVETLGLSGTYADFVISLKFWGQAKIQGERWRHRWSKVIRSLGIRGLLLPYTVLADKLRRGAHIGVLARKPSQELP